MQAQLIKHSAMFQNKEMHLRGLETFNSIADSIKKLAVSLKSLRLLSSGVITEFNNKNDYQYMLMDILEIIRRSSVREIDTKLHPVRINKLFSM